MAADSSTVELDCVNYYLFPRLPTVKTGKSTLELLEELNDSYTAFLTPYLVQYIWQNEPFVLRPYDGTNENLPPHIAGKTNFGDNVDDEWFIVFLLNELTKGFPDLIVRAVDSDAEFILIEMAENLPKWMNPETTENRVFMYQGNVHIVPIGQKNGILARLSNGTPSIADAISAIREFHAVTKCDAKVQKPLARRIGCFPDKIKESQCRAHCYLPASLAVLLKQYPSLLSPAVNAFYLRTPSDLQVCRSMKYFPPETRVMTDVTFTKCLYAQLIRQKYSPDKRVGWNLPQVGSVGFKAADFGMKLACGFEILASTAGNREETREAPSESDLSLDPRWSRFFKKLEDNDFFQGHLAGSKFYVAQLEKAKLFYLENIQENRTKDLNIGQRVLSLLDEIEVDMDLLKQAESNLDPPDDDNWLDFTSAQLDTYLEKKFGINYAENVSAALKNFVELKSGIEGVEVPKMRDSNLTNNKANRVTLDPDGFSDAMQSILDFKLPDWEEGSSSDMSDYSDEDELLEMGSKSGNSDVKNKVKSQLNAMKQYMEKMDRELVGTAVLETEKPPEDTCAPMKNVDDKPKPEEKLAFSAKSETMPEDLDSFKPVDIDLSSLSSLLASYRLQQGEPGPASTLLSSMGLGLPNN